ncbi:AraC family transcriptional regulator [Parendozoicomonas haliclonae]|uniref:Transcriptional activator FeaR n=1 Tax=Parendozoicomonas haliclonae TaxID=1960125 RepID=A0A1X7ANY0_9GAMM|nr:AraC family transcriptional regulator [Parendozoicomonas haliclonae]SMA49965.1 Transcriptional activator FeaR [Parendozoicomonas haliclonae]
MNQQVYHLIFMDIFVSAKTEHMECSCYPWSIQIGSATLSLYLQCPKHSSGQWNQFNGYIVDNMLLCQIDSNGLITGQPNRPVAFQAENITALYIPQSGSVHLGSSTGTDKPDRHSCRTTILPGQIGLLSSSETEDIQFSPDFKGLVVAISDSWLDNALRQHANNYSLNARSGPALLARQMLENLPGVLNNEGSMSRRRELSRHFQGLLAMALKTEWDMSPQLSDRQQKHLYRILDKIDHHMIDPDLDLEAIAEQVYLSPSYISRLLAQNGTSFRDELRQRRLQRVASALANPARKNTSVTLIALESGFGNSSAFSRAFLKHFGKTPSKYRQHYLTEQLSKSGKALTKADI